MTIGASPTACGRGISLANELELVKAALLYGDQAALCSPICTMLLSVVMLGNSAAQAPAADQLRVFRQVFGSMIDEDLSGSLDVFEELRAKRHRGTRENMNLIRLESYALLDADAANLMRAQIDEGKLSVPDAMIGRGRHIALAGDVLRRLPNFGGATLAEIIDIRRELENPLKRFRKICSTIPTVSHAHCGRRLSMPKPTEFSCGIEPAVVELEEAVKSKSYLQALVGRYLRNSKDFIVPLATPPVAAPVLSLFAADTQALLLIAGSVLVGAAHLSAVLWDVRNEVRKTPQPEQNHLFFAIGQGRCCNDTAHGHIYS